MKKERALVIHFFRHLCRRSTFKSLSVVVFLLLVSLLSSCEDEIANNHKSSIVFPDSGISFIKHVEPLFRETCLGGECHSSLRPAMNLDLETNAWHNLIDFQPQLIIPKNGKNSPLIMYLDGRLQPLMPLRSDPLNQNQVKGVQRWIDEGASPF